MRAKLKTEKNHALVYINPCFYFGSGGLHPLKNRSKCSYTRDYVVFHGPLDWGLKVWILIVLISFKLDLKRVYMTKNRNESTISLLFSRRRHSHNRRVDSFFKPAWFLWLRNTENVRFESYAIVFDDAIYCCQDVPVVQSWTRSHGLSELC